MTGVAFIEEAEAVAEPNAEWVASVQSDLRKASARFGSLLRNEAEANMAVFLAEHEVETATESRAEQAKNLKERHVLAVAAVNMAEAALADELADGANCAWSISDPSAVETAEAKLAPLVNAYKQALEERATTIYGCTTQTLAGRQALARVTKKRDACRRHLVAVVADRNEAESEMTRIHTLLIEKAYHETDLLTTQLECVAPAESPLALAQKCSPARFHAQCAISHNVFKSE